MPATTLAQIKNFADPIEQALYAVFESVGGRAKLPRAEGLNEDEVWIVPTFQCGPANGHLIKRPDGQHDYDMFVDCRIEWDLSVPRTTAHLPPEVIASTYSLFTQEITRLRLAMDPAREATLNNLLLYHKLTKLVPLAATMGFDTDRAEDRAQIAWRCTLGIRPDAWPVAATAYTNLP